MFAFDFFLAFMLIVSLVAICAIGIAVGVAPLVKDFWKMLQSGQAAASATAPAKASKHEDDTGK